MPRCGKCHTELEPWNVELTNGERRARWFCPRCWAQREGIGHEIGTGSDCGTSSANPLFQWDNGGRSG